VKLYHDDVRIFYKRFLAKTMTLLCWVWALFLEPETNSEKRKEMVQYRSSI